MKLTTMEQVIEDIAVLLMSLDPKDRPGAASEAADLAARATNGWWEMPGSPHFNMRLANLREKLKL